MPIIAGQGKQKIVQNEWKKSDSIQSKKKKMEDENQNISAAEDSPP